MDFSKKILNLKTFVRQAEKSIFYELRGYLVEKDNKITVVETIKGGRTFIRPSISIKPEGMIGIIHSHPVGVKENFSEEDMKYIEQFYHSQIKPFDSLHCVYSLDSKKIDCICNLEGNMKRVNLKEFKEVKL